MTECALAKRAVKFSRSPEGCPSQLTGAEPECPALGTQRHGVAEGRAFQSNRAVVARHRGAQLCDGLISADVSDFDATGDHIAWANGSGEIPIDVEKYASRELLCDDRVQDCAGYATLDHDLPESRRLRRQKVVVQRIAITADLGEPFDISCRNGTTHFRNFTHLGSAIRPR